MTTKRLEFSPKTKVLACLRYYPELKHYAEGLTNEKATALLPDLLKQIKCVGLSELRLKCFATPVEIDHIMRCEIKPDNSPENGRPLCRTCHKIKSARDAMEAAKGRRLRNENKPKRKAKIQSRGFPSPEEQEKAKQWKRRTG